MADCWVCKKAECWAGSMEMWKAVTMAEIMADVMAEKWAAD